MARLAKLYRRIGGMLPQKYVDGIKDIFVHSGKRHLDAEEHLGSVTVFSFFIGAIIPLVPFALGQPFAWYWAAAVLPAIGITHYLAYLLAYIGLEDYTKRIEGVLPDFLRLVASNIRSGMTPFQALKLAARPEFGPLRDEVEYVTTRGIGNENFQELILSINQHIRSDSLDRVLKLFSSTLKSGGHLAQILEESSNYIEEKRRLKRELETITKSYTIFIMFSVVIIAPFLLSISTQFLSMVISIQGITKGAESVAGFGGKITISVEFLRICSIIFLVGTSVLASMLMAVIKQEKMQYGFKYTLIILTCSLAAYFGAQNVIGSMFA